MNSNDTFMKERPVFPLLMSMALPMVVSMLVNSLYNIVDSYFVAKISEDAMTALSLVYPIQNFINALAIGFGIGMNSQISYHLGAKNAKAANKAATLGTLLSAIHGLVMAVICFLIISPFLQMFTANADVIDLGVRYARIIFLGAVIVSLDLSFEKIFQAEGRMTACMVGLSLGCITNIILDPIMIFGLGPCPEMGIEGAAIATVIGQVVNLLTFFAAIKMQPLHVKLRREFIEADGTMIRRLYSVGIPAILNLALPSLLISVLNGLLAAYSQSYIVVLGIYYKLQTFLYLPANGIIQGMRPIIGYNYGAKEYKRVQKIYLTALATTGLIMLVGTGICLAVPGKLIAIFSTNPETISLGGTALRIISAGFIISAVSITTSGALEGLGKGKQSLWISLSRFLVVIIPAAFLLTMILGAVGVWNAFWIAEAAACIISLVLSKKVIFGKFH